MVDASAVDAVGSVGIDGYIAGGGCDCDVDGQAAHGRLLWLAVLALVLSRHRRPSKRPRRDRRVVP
jgi:hypothetical protein